VNHGKSTPGLDHVVGTTSEARGALCRQLSALDRHRVHPGRRVDIATRKGTRPRGSPPIGERGGPARVKTALAPGWEARFDGISSGLRPGRGWHDASENVLRRARPNPTRPWVFEAAIAGAFDNSGHTARVPAMGNVPARAWSKPWLNAGDGADERRPSTEAGVPQGGVLSPLWLTVALHGREQALGTSSTPKGVLRGT
jgi:RNA-directed DNA polymerase